MAGGPSTVAPMNIYHLVPESRHLVHRRTIQANVLSKSFLIYSSGTKESLVYLFCSFENYSAIDIPTRHLLFDNDDDHDVEDYYYSRRVLMTRSCTV